MRKNKPSFINRRNAIKSDLSNHQAILFSSPSDIFYLANFKTLVEQERESFLLVCKNNSFLIHPSFSPLPEDNDLLMLSGSHYSQINNHLEKIIKQNKITQLVIDPRSLFQIEYQQLEKLNIELISDLSNPTENLRKIKDQYEIMQIEKSCRLATKTLSRVKKYLQIGITEKQLSSILEKEMNQLGSEKIAFPTIVAFGANTALPHHQPTNKKLINNTPILIDYGAKVNGYCSDMTRTFWFGNQKNPLFSQIEKTVKNAYKNAVENIKQNFHQPTQIKNIDQAAREIIEKNGFGANFIHTTGHGLGIDIHEQPSINWQNPTLLKPNMIITIEPGIYLQNKFGFRYENTILIGENFIKELT